MRRGYNNNYSVLPFYTDIQMQYRHLTYSFGSVYPLYVPKGMRPCFQIVVPAASGDELMQSSDLTFYLMDKNDNYVPFHTGTGAAASTISMYDDIDTFYDAQNGCVVIIGYGEYDHSASGATDTQILPLGTYYIKLVDSHNDRTYFSEFFTAVDFISNWTRVEWRCLDDINTDSGKIYYSIPQAGEENRPFRNVVHLLTQLGKPDYQFDEEGENRDGHFFPTKQVSYKKYKAVFEAPEYLLDVMRLIRLADIVTVTDPYGTAFPADTFLITPQWADQGDLATVTLEMTSNTVVKRCGKAIS